MPKYGATTPEPATNAPATATLKFSLSKTVLAWVYIRLIANWTITGGTGVGTILNDALQRYLRKIVYHADGRPVQAWSGRALQTLALFLLPKPPLNTQPTSLAAGANQAVELWLQVPFLMWHSGRPDDYAAPTFAKKDPQIQIETGNPGDLARGEDGVAGFTNPRIEIHEVPLVDAPRVAGYGEIQADTYELPVTVAKDYPLDLDLTPAGRSIRGILIEAEDNGAGGVQHSPNDTIVTHVALNVNGLDKVEKSTWDYWQNRNAQVYNLTAKRAGAVFLDAAENGETWGAGLWGILDGYTPKLRLSCVPSGVGESLVRVTVITAAAPQF